MRQSYCTVQPPVGCRTATGVSLLFNAELSKELQSMDCLCALLWSCGLLGRRPNKIGSGVIAHRFSVIEGNQNVQARLVSVIMIRLIQIKCRRDTYNGSSWWKLISDIEHFCPLELVYQIEMVRHWNCPLLRFIVEYTASIVVVHDAANGGKVGWRVERKWRWRRGWRLARG